MMSATRIIEPAFTIPRTLSFCPACGEQTPHELHEGDGVIAKICVRCAERDLTDIFGRD